MTYFGVLLRFIGPPLVILAAVALWDRRRGRAVRPWFATWPAWAVLWGHAAIALIYTTPWDNYLVATRVWWYDPALVTGLTLGWVPIEEYTFFVVQTLMAGLWLLALMRRLPAPAESFQPRTRMRWIVTVVAGLFWAVWLVLLLAGWSRPDVQPARYMALILVWFLPPVMGQLGFGADILWHHRRLVLAGLLPTFLYLCLVDFLAIASGTWTISDQDTLGIELGQVLPLEEITFFWMTSVVIAFGMVLMLARESHERVGWADERPNLPQQETL